MMKGFDFDNYTYGFVLNRINDVITSCTTIVQVKIARRYCNRLIYVYVKKRFCEDDTPMALSPTHQILYDYIDDLTKKQEREILHDGD